jgi:hypothetical protein
MDEGKRPGGLTALAVINFVLFGFGLIGLLSLVATYAGWIPTAHITEEQKAPIEALQDMSLPLFVMILALSLISNLLLILSGIGYLKQKKILGRLLGNAYAVLSIVSSVVSGTQISSEAGGGFTIGTLIGLIYPILTLVLLNTTFRDDLTN